MAAKIRKRRDRKGTWIVDYVDATGARRRRHARTREAAEKVLAADLKEAQSAQPAVGDPDVTVEQYSKRWLDDQIAFEVHPRTQASYRQITKLYVLPKIGEMRLRDVRLAHVKDLLAQEARRGLARNTLRLIRATLSVMFGSAMEDDIISANPAQYRTKRKRRIDKTSVQERQESIRALDEAQLGNFERGGPLDESRVRKYFGKAMKEAKLSGFRLYDLRHTYATLLLAKSVPVTYVAAQLGHAKPTTTLAWYAHWLPSPDSNRYADLLDERPIPEAVSQKVGTKVGTIKEFRGFDVETRRRSSRKIRRLENGPPEIRTPDPLIKSQLL